MAQEDHDQRLKEAVKSKFSDAIELLLPDRVPLFDYMRLEWIEQEIFPDPPKGERRAIDILAKMPTTKPIATAVGQSPATACVGLVHVELEGWDTITASNNLLGVALASMMRIAEDAKAKAKADALQKIAGSSEPEMRKYLLCECVDTYLPLEEVQMKDYDQLLVTPAYQGARKYGKTSYELGQIDLLREQLVCRFGPLNEEASKRLEACSKAQALELGKKLLTATSLRDLGLES